MDCKSCDIVTRRECDERHKSIDRTQERHEQCIQAHTETLAAAVAILKHVTEHPVTPVSATAPATSKSFLESKGGLLIIFGVVAVILIVVAYALGVQNVERVLNALPK